MVYSEIFLNTKPWTSGAVLLGIVAEDPKSGRVRILRAAASSSKTGGTRERDAIDRFLSSLEALAKSMNAGTGRRSVGAILKSVPDRGTSFQFSGVRSGEFKSSGAALKFCVAKTLPVRPSAVGPVGLPATA